MFDTPPFFKLIQESSQTEWKEMYQVFNMGHRMEIYCSKKFAQEVIIPEAKKLKIEAKIIGHVKKNADPMKNSLTIISKEGKYEY